MSEDTHRAKKRQRSPSSNPIADGGEGDGSDGSDGCSQRKCPKTSGSGARVGEHPSDKGGDSSASGTGGHIESANSGNETAPPRVTKAPSWEPSTPRRRILNPNMSWLTWARRAALIDEADNGGLGEPGSRKGQPV